MANLGIGELVVLAAALLVLALPLVLMTLALVDVARRPDWQWPAAGQNRVAWVLVILIISGIGPAVYLVMARPKLERVAGHGPTV